jgi:N4-gp56 family major capsid protein
MDASVVTAYDKAYLLAFVKRQVWSSVLWPKMLRKVTGGKELKGKTVQVPVYEPLGLVTSHLTESADVVPEAFGDSYVTVTMYEEGNVVQHSRLLDLTSYTEVGEPIAEALAAQQAERLDRIVRDAIVMNASHKLYGGDATSRVTCGTASTSDVVTYAKIVEAVTRAEVMGITPFDDGTYVAIVHPAVMTELTALNEWAYPAYYQDKGVLSTGLQNNGKKMFTYEVGALYRLRIISHPLGKLFLGAGVAAQAATTSTADVAKSATTITVSDASGLAAGNYITVGTLESSTTAYPTTEQVKIVSVASTTLTIQGAGGTHDDFGFKFAHSSGASVIEACNVAAIPILGPRSAIIAHPSELDATGEVVLNNPAPTNIPKRFFNHSWYNVLGAAIVQKQVVALEVATAGNTYGNN